TAALAKRAVTEVRLLEGAQPPVLLGEYDIAADIARKDPGFVKAIERRGLKMDDVFIDGWAPGLISPEERASGKRLIRVLGYYKGAGRNHYAHPIEGLIATVDMNARNVISLIDTDPQPMNAANEALDEKSIAACRGGVGEARRRLETSAPEGASYKVDGQQIRWQGWSFRYSLQPMKGLVLYEIAFEEEPGKPRPILYKAGISEMVV